MLGELLYSGDLTFESDAEFVSQIEHLHGSKVPGNGPIDRWVVYGCDDFGAPTVTFYSRIVGAPTSKFSFVEYRVKRKPSFAIVPASNLKDTLAAPIDSNLFETAEAASDAVAEIALSIVAGEPGSDPDYWDVVETTP